MNETRNIKNTCFVCHRGIDSDNSSLNQEVFLWVCNKCKGTGKEKEAVAEQLDSLADGLVCGCI